MLGIIAVEHARSALLGRCVIDDPAANDGISLRDINIQLESPLRVPLTLPAEESIDLETIDGVKARIEERLGREIVLEASVRLVRCGGSA